MISTIASKTSSASFQNPTGDADGREAEASYRSVCKTAVLTLMFGLFSLGSVLTPTFVILPLIGLGFAFLTWISFRRFPMELVGQSLWKIGMILNAVMLVASLGYHIYCYNTEVPPDYQRISFRLLRTPAKSAEPFNDAAAELDGKKVFIKGYVRPSDRKSNLKDFILVGDFGSCCFGGSPKITDVIGVSIQTDERVNYSWRLRHIGGTFRLNRHPERTSEKDVPLVVYSIEADYIK